MNASDRLEAKRAAAGAALGHVPAGVPLAVGSGSTVDVFIDLLAAGEHRPPALLVASEATGRRARAAGFAVLGLAECPAPEVYVDGADVVDDLGRTVKGGGAAMTREKVLATASARFVCIVDDGKPVTTLTDQAVPLEVLETAGALVVREVGSWGATLDRRRDVWTDNGNAVFDARGLDLSGGEDLEVALEAIPGVVGCGLFARRRADLVIVGSGDGSVVERAPSGRSAPDREGS